MMGTLEKLQNSLLGHLQSLADLNYADIRAEGRDVHARGGKAEGMEVEIMLPMPTSASKYAAGPTFSDVDVCIEVVRDPALAATAPSILTVCEIISRALHKWTPPLECGYGKMALAQNSPWKRGDAANGKTKITLKFNVQSVLS